MVILLKLSTKGRYSVKAMVDLAINSASGPVNIKSIAERQKISEYYLEQLFATLRKANIILSVRGAAGGYTLARPAKYISIKEIIDTVEGPIGISNCIEGENCSNMDLCPTRLLWFKLSESINSVMKNISLEDIIADYKKITEKESLMMKREVYMDYAATTFVKPEIFDAMVPYYKEFYANPSSIYSISREPQMAIDDARERVAKSINADRSEIYFTGGGSEADNWAIKGIAFANKGRGNHLITSTIEHHAILHTFKYLEKQGFEVTYLPVDSEGRVSMDDFKNAIKDTTILVSIMFANNEIGTIQNIKEIGSICRERKIIFHTDAVQAMGHLKIDVKDMNIDLLSIAAHKIYGPKGIGALYIRKGIRIHNLIEGGGQERGRRAGTENVAGIVALGLACEMAVSKIDEESARLQKLSEVLIDGLLKIPYSRLNGPKPGLQRLPNNINMCFNFIEGESILLMLDEEGISASSGSACTSGSLDPSHVLLAIGLPHEIAHGSLRLSLGAKTTMEDVNYVLEVVPRVVEKLRNMSPLWHDHIKGGKKS